MYLQKQPFQRSWLPTWVSLRGQSARMHFVGRTKHADQAQKFMKSNNISRNRCYVADDTFSSTIRYMVVSPPINAPLRKVMKALKEMEFFQLWYNEMFEICSSPGVQERSRMKGLMNMWEGEEHVKPIKLVEGKLKNVFILWLVCQCIALSTFVLEIMCSIYSTLLTIHSIQASAKDLW